MMSLVQKLLGTVPADYAFIPYVLGSVLSVLFIALFLRFLLGAISNIFYH